MAPVLPRDGTIYLVRHGETIWNRAGRIQGHGDSPLTCKGIAQAEAAAALLARTLEGDPTVWCSPSFRCQQTAAILCERLDIGFETCQPLGLLRELGYGDWEGLSRDDIEARYPGELARREADRWHHVAPGGESHQQLHERAVKVLLTPHSGPLVLVTHAGTSRMLRGLWLELAPGELLRLTHLQSVVYRLSGRRVDALETGGPP